MYPFVILCPYSWSVEKHVLAGELMWTHCIRGWCTAVCFAFSWVWRRLIRMTWKWSPHPSRVYVHLKQKRKEKEAGITWQDEGGITSKSVRTKMHHKAKNQFWIGSMSQIYPTRCFQWNRQNKHQLWRGRTDKGTSFRWKTRIPTQTWALPVFRIALGVMQAVILTALPVKPQDLFIAKVRWRLSQFVWLHNTANVNIEMICWIFEPIICWYIEVWMHQS